MIFFVLLLVFQIGLISAEENASITGKATSSGTSLTIVVNAAPSLNLLSPSNGTYLTGQKCVGRNGKGQDDQDDE